MKAIVKNNFEFEGQKGHYVGKVRDVYNINDDYLVMVVSDRISAFDVACVGNRGARVNAVVEELGGEVVKIVFLMELEGLNGRDKLQGYDVDSVIKYPGK